MAINILEIAKTLPPWAMLGLGVVTGGLKAVWSFLYEHTIGYLVTRVSISLTVEDSEHRDAYIWLSCWVEKHLRHRNVTSLLLRIGVDVAEYGSSASSRFAMIPEYGSYYLPYRRRLMTVEHHKESPSNTHQRRSTHSIKLRLWLSWDRNALLAILDEARQAYEQNRSSRLEYFRADAFGDWVGCNIPGRALTSVFHPPELLHDLCQDVQTFLSSRKIYADLGMPYRRGYLLSGPPGTGKSSLILAIATHFGLPIYAVPLRGTQMDGQRLSILLANCRKPAVIAFEDIDCLKVATTRDAEIRDGLTMADLLNVIDGIGASEDRLLFMTANHPETLDYALTRAGRVDRKFHIGYARNEELKCLYDRVAQYRPVPEWTQFRAALPEQATIADAQALAFQTTGVEA